MLEQRIRKLAAYVKENNLHLTEFYFYDANWSFCGEDEIQEIKDMDEYKHSDSIKAERSAGSNAISAYRDTRLLG